jgi:pyruvate/2-oxoglutarate dehydrogenase complex dihydrolipoamide dehydrogenase (E3) component
LSGAVTVDFERVMARMRRLRAKISRHDSARRFRDLGVDVFFGEGRFVDREAVEVNGKTLRFKKAVIATGTRAARPPIEGLDRTGHLTNETLFSLTECPPKLAVLGAGPIGCEMGQAFRRLGSEVVLFHKHPRILNREDPDASELLQSIFVKEGVHLVLGSNPTRVYRETGRKAIEYERNGVRDTVVVDEILVAAGRTPNVERLNLEAAGVDYDGKGIVVDDRLRTSNPNVYAAGDVAMRYRFTHAADAAARIVIQNALFFGRKKVSALTVPWCTYTEPEVAHVGLYEEDARRQGIEAASFVRQLRDVDRAVTDGAEGGFVKVLVKKGSDKILGATIVASDAGNMISEVTLAMVGKVGLGAVAGVIHPYPTTAEAIKQLGDAYNRTRLTPFVKKLFKAWLALTR